MRKRSSDSDSETKHLSEHSHSWSARAERSVHVHLTARAAHRLSLSLRGLSAAGRRRGGVASPPRCVSVFLQATPPCCTLPCATRRHLSLAWLSAAPTPPVTCTLDASSPSAGVCLCRQRPTHISDPPLSTSTAQPHHLSWRCFTSPSTLESPADSVASFSSPPWPCPIPSSSCSRQRAVSPTCRPPLFLVALTRSSRSRPPPPPPLLPPAPPPRPRPKPSPFQAACR